MEFAAVIEAYLDDVHGGVNEECVRAFNDNHNMTLTIQQELLHTFTNTKGTYVVQEVPGQERQGIF